MKKKRTEKHTIKRRDDSGNHTIPLDTHHNTDTPCCDLIRDVIAEIFPYVADAAEVKVDGENGQNDKSTDVKLAAVEGKVKEQPLLGFMIQKYLIEQYQRSGRAAVSNQQSGSDAAKSKKKKKKKKKSSANADSSGNGENSEEKEEEGSSAVQDGVNNDQNGDDHCDQPAANDAKTAQTSTLPLSETAKNTALSVLDCFLDSIIATHASHHLENTRADRDLESFAAYLGRKYNTGMQRSDTHKNGKKKDNKSITNPETDLINILPTINIDDLKVHTTNIKCRLCQTSVNSHVKSLSQGLHQTNNTLKWGNDVEAVNHNQGLFVLDEQSTTISKRHPLTINGFDDERAFDYYQMMDDNLDLEAGNAVEATHSSAFWLEFYPLCKSEDYDAKFLQVKPSAGKEHFPLDIDSIINLVKSVILSCGIELAADSNDQQLSDAELETIVESAQRLCTEHRTTFYQINDMKIQMQTSLENAAKSNNRTAFDSASTTALNSCNEYCEIVLKRIGNLLITITKMTCFVGWRTNEFGPFLMEKMVKCWEMFNITLFKLIEPTMQYRGSVLQLCRRPGVVPLMASDKMMRDRFTKYLHTKIAMIEKLITFLDETLINPNQKSYRGHVHQAPSPLARLCVLEAFMSYSYKSQNSSVPNIFSSEEDEVGFVKLLAARVCLSQQVLKGATKSNIETKERDNFLEVKALYASIVKTVVINEADYQTAPEFIKAYHDGVAKERAKADRRLKFEPEEYSPELISSLMHTSQLLTMEWIYVLCMRQSYSHVEFALPSRLENWMESITGSNITVHKFDRDDITTRCDGAGAKRRVSSILAVLLYRWLETRCFEWHAELTQNELLTAVDFDSVVAEGVAKSGKKKKSKKKAGGGKPIDVQREPIPESTTSPPEDDGTKSEHAQNSLVGKDTNETELQPSSPNAVDEDIDDAEEKLNSKPKSICSIDVVNVDAVAKPTLLPKDQKNDQPVSKKAKAKKTAGNGGTQVVHNASSEVNTTKTSAASVVGGSSNVHTTNNENNDHKNFIKVERSVTKKTTSSQTPTNGTNKVIASPSSENKSEQSSQTAKGSKQTPGVAREPKSTLPPAAKSTNKVANSSTSKEVQKTTQLSDPKQVVKQSPAISVKKIHSSDQSAPSKPTAANKVTATVDFSNASPATNINETPHATRPSRAKPLASKTEKAVKPSEAKPNTKQTVKSNSSQAPVTIPAAQQTKRATEPPETDTKPTQVPVYKNSDTSSGKVPMQTPLDENHQSVGPAPKETLQVDTEHEDTSNEKVHSGSTQADETPYLQPRVGVIDNRGNIISAEEFLVGRMESLLTEIEEIKSRYTLWF